MLGADGQFGTADDEQCDEGSRNGVGGCTLSCTVMPGWDCSGNPPTCLPITQQMIIDDQNNWFNKDGYFSGPSGVAEPGGYRGSEQRIPVPANETLQASWTFNQLSPGSYDVYVGYPNTLGERSVRYTISGDSQTSVIRDQSVKYTPTSPRVWSGAFWDKIGTVTLNGPSGIAITIEPEKNLAVAKAMVADAVMVARQGNSCGNGTVDAFEMCEADNQCPAGKMCSGCQCGPSVDASAFNNWVSFSSPHRRVYPPNTIFLPAKNDPVPSLVDWSIAAFDDRLMTFGDDGYYWTYNKNNDHYPDWTTIWSSAVRMKMFNGSSWDPSPILPHFGRQEATTRGMIPFFNSDDDNKIYFIALEKTMTQAYDDTVSVIRYWSYFDGLNPIDVPPDINNSSLHELHLPMHLDRSISGAFFRGKMWVMGQNDHAGGLYFWSLDPTTGTATGVAPVESLSSNVVSKLAVYKDRLWVITNKGIQSTPDGVSWIHELSPWGTSSTTDIIPFVYDGRLWVSKGGTWYVTEGNNTWTDVTAQVPENYGIVRAVVHFLGGLWIDSESGPAEPVSKCGDGIVNGWDQCDGENLNGKTCADARFYDGTLACKAPGTFLGCTFDTDRCDFNYVLKVQQEGEGGIVRKGQKNVTLARFRLSLSEPLSIDRLRMDLAGDDLRLFENLSLWTDVNDDGVLENVKGTVQDYYDPGHFEFQTYFNEQYGMLQRRVSGNQVIEIHGDIKQDTTATTVTLKGRYPGTMDQRTGYNSFIGGKDADGQWISWPGPHPGGTTLNGVRCPFTRASPEACSISMNTYDVTWTVTN
jgi:hypothetical protein